MDISLAPRAHDISTSRLTSNQCYIGQQITVSKNLFLKHNSTDKTIFSGAITFRRLSREVTQYRNQCQ